MQKNLLDMAGSFAFADKYLHQPSGSSRNFRGEMPIRSVNAPEKLASDR